MAKCDRCGKYEGMPYNCRFCGGTYCGEHRLPENHDCPGLEGWNDPSGVFDSGFDDSVKKPGKSKSSVARKVGFNRGTGGPLGYFRGNMTFVFLGLMWITFLLEFVVIFTAGEELFNALFVLDSEHVAYIWTWVTSIFAHSPNGLAHVALNSIVLYFFGPIVERRLGSAKFAALFLAAGIVAGLAQVGTAILMGDPSAVLGASGAIMAVMGVLTVLNPKLRVYLYFILPMPLWVLTIGFALYSVFVALSPGGGIGAGNVAHLAHLAGLVVGLGYGEKLKREGMRAPKQLQFGGRGGGRGRF